MQRFLTLLALAFATLVGTSCPTMAKKYTPKSVPNVQVEDYRRFVSNPDNILSPTAVYTIDTTLLRLKENRIAEVAVVAVESIGFAEPREFATDLFRHWGIGEKERDNGLLFLLVLGQGAIEIEVGYGLEGTLTDALCKRTIERLMIPRFKQEDFDGGMVAGVEAIAAILTEGAVPEELAAQEEESDLVGLAIFLGTVALFIALICVLLRMYSRCPKCKKGTLVRTSERMKLEKNSFQNVYKVAFKCNKCGHVVWRNEVDDNHDIGSGGGPIIMGGGGFGRGGGFGGGFSGGGGAGGRF